MSDKPKIVTFPRELSDDLAELIAEKARVCGGGAFDIWEAICEQFGQAAPAVAREVALKAFASEMISASFEGGSFEGGGIQDIAVKHGLLQVEQRTEECGEVCACREYGFPAECYRKTDLVKGGEQ